MWVSDETKGRLSDLKPYDSMSWNELIKILADAEGAEEAVRNAAKPAATDGGQ